MFPPRVISRKGLMSETTAAVTFLLSEEVTSGPHLQAHLQTWSQDFRLILGFWVPLKGDINVGPHKDRKTSLHVRSAAATQLVLQLDVRHRLTLGQRVKLRPLQTTSGYSCQAINILHRMMPGPADTVMWPHTLFCFGCGNGMTTSLWFQLGVCGSMF